LKKQTVQVFNKTIISLFGFLLLIGCGNKPVTTDLYTGNKTLTVTIGPGAQNLGSQGFGANPLTIPVGTTVVWVNNDTVIHTVTSDDNIWNSGDINPGASWSYQFNYTGLFSYYCEHFPSMTSVIDVYN
jgi:plastocyanin